MSAAPSVFGVGYEGAIDLDALRSAHRPAFERRTEISVDGNTAAAIPFLQWWRAPIVAGFPITPSTKWLEFLAAEVATGRFDVEVAGRRVAGKRVKLLEAEHAVADYLVGVAGACRHLVVGTATSSVGLDHMAETVRSLGASGLGNVVIVNVCRATANFPLCIEGDPSDHLAHRDSGFLQVMCRGRQQIYDTILQMPAVGMHPDVLTPSMPAYYGIKDSHRSSALVVEPDEEVNAFLDEALALSRPPPPGLLDGDTSMGSCVTSEHFQGFKLDQKLRMAAAPAVMAQVAALFERRFGRPGLTPFEQHGMDGAGVALVAMGPDAGTALQMLPRLSTELGTKVGLVILRLLTPFPSAALAEALAGVAAVGVVHNAHHHGRGHLALDVSDALARAGRSVPVDSFFCGLGGADVSHDSWRTMARTTVETAARGRLARGWRLVHEGRVLAEGD